MSRPTYGRPTAEERAKIEGALRVGQILTNLQGWLLLNELERAEANVRELLARKEERRATDSPDSPDSLVHTVLLHVSERLRAKEGPFLRFEDVSIDKDWANDPAVHLTAVLRDTPTRHPGHPATQCDQIRIAVRESFRQAGIDLFPHVRYRQESDQPDDADEGEVDA